MVLTYAKDINKAKKYLNCRLQSKSYLLWQKLVVKSIKFY